MSMTRDMHISNAAITTVPAGSATVILWDSTADPGTGTTLARRRAFPGLKRAIVRIFMDQAATFKINDLSKSETVFRTVNGGGAGEPIAINTWFERDALFTSDDSQLVVVTGTVPTVWNVSVRPCTDRALAQ